MVSCTPRVYGGEPGTSVVDVVSDGLGVGEIGNPPRVSNESFRSRKLTPQSESGGFAPSIVPC